jgi:hypothetical protein
MTETMLTEVNMPQAAPAPRAKKNISIPKRKKQVDAWIVVLPNITLISQLEEVEDAASDIEYYQQLLNASQKEGDTAKSANYIKMIESLRRAPNCRMLEPFVIADSKNYSLIPYLIEYTNDNQFMIHSDKIITLAKPNAVLQSKYESLLNG